MLTAASLSGSRYNCHEMLYFCFPYSTYNDGALTLSGNDLFFGLFCVTVVDLSVYLYTYAEHV